MAAVPEEEAEAMDAIVGVMDLLESNNNLESQPSVIILSARSEVG